MLRAFFAILAPILFLYPMFPLLILERQVLRRINPDWMHKSSAVLVRGLFRLMLFFSGTRVTIKGRENIPDGPVLYVGNHRSYFDILVGYVAIPGDCGIIGKKELNKIPLLGLWMDNIHCLFLDRENPREGLRTILAGVEKLRSGISILIFPEGTRSKTGELLPFHEGSFKLATRAGVPIVPVAQIGTEKIMHHKVCVRKMDVTISFGEPIYVTGLSRAEEKLLPERARQSIQTMLIDNQSSIAGRS